MSLENGCLHISSPNTQFVVSTIGKLFLDEKTADIHFQFETNGIERIPAHKHILSAGSNVYDTMFYGSLPEGDVVKIPIGNNPSAFKEFLQFFYLEKVELTTEHIADVMNLVRQYGIEGCMVQCVDFLKATVTIEDVCSAYQLAIKYDLDDLKHFCLEKILENVEDVFKTEDFLECDRDLLKHIVQIDSFKLTDVFDACVAWAQKSCENKNLDPQKGINLRGQLGETILRYIHFDRMEMDEFASRNLNYVGLLTLDHVSEIIHSIACRKSKPRPFREKPMSKISKLDEKRNFECSFSDLMRTDESRRNNRILEVFPLSSNLPLILHKIKFARVAPVRRDRPFEGTEISKVDLKIFEKTDGDAKSVRLERFQVSCEHDAYVVLGKPLFIQPNRSYWFRLHYNGVNNFTSPLMEYGRIKIDDLELNLTDNGPRTAYSQSDFTLVSAMYFYKV